MAPLWIRVTDYWFNIGENFWPNFSRVRGADDRIPRHCWEGQTGGASPADGDGGCSR